MLKRPIILFDLDGTLVDYHQKLRADLNKIAGPGDPTLDALPIPLPRHLKARRDMITSQSGWWLNLEPYPPGWDLLKEAINFAFRVVVLSKGPVSKPNAWAEKVQWCDRHLKGLVEGITLTHDKSLVHGDVLIDDWPGFISRWLECHPGGLVIMPAHPHNAHFIHPQVLRYDGTNLYEVRNHLRATLHPLDEGNGMEA